MTLNAPASTIPTIIGPKGATLKKIRDQTGVRVDIPRRDSLPVPNGNGSAHPVSGNGSPASQGDDEEEEEITVPVMITGPLPLAHEAEASLKEIIAAKRSRTTQRVRDIPGHILPFLISRRGVFIAAAQGGDIHLALNLGAREITVSGEREAVARVVDKIRDAQDYYKAEVQQAKLFLPKRQHRLLTGKGAEDILATAKCAVIVPTPEEPSDEIIIWGRNDDLGSGVQAVMQKANSAYIHEFPLPGPPPVTRQLLTYITHVGYAQTLSTQNPGCSVYIPSLAALEKSTVLNVEMIGEKSAVDSTVSDFSALIGKLFGATKELPIDWLVHRIINSPKNAKK